MKMKHVMGCAVLALAAFGQPAAAATINLTNFGTQTLGQPPSAGSSYGLVEVEDETGSASQIPLGGTAGQLVIDAGDGLTAPGAGFLSFLKGTYDLVDFEAGSSGSAYRLNLGGITAGDRISFRYAFGTTETLDFATDAFRIGVVQALTGTTQLLGAGDVETSFFSPIDLPVLYDFRTAVFEVDFTFLAGGDYFLEFLVWNAFDDLFASGLVIGDVTLVPEPGTMALFGLGLLGVGAAVRRRRAAA